MASLDHLSSSNRSSIILAAGGTGGHIFPAEALAEVLVARGEKVRFVTDRRFKTYNSASYKGVIGTLPIDYIQAASPSGGLISKARALVGIGLGVMQAMRILRTHKPRVVVGFGGYPSFPTMLAATLLGVPTVIHEQNSVLGKANRFLAPRVTRIATTYAATQRMPKDARAEVVWTGNPIRAAVKALAQVEYPTMRGDGLLKMLVIGGSQGASVFSDVVPQAMALLPEALRARVRIDQQCRPAELERTREAYGALNMQVDLAPFFADVAARMAGAHVVISRSGASSVAELTAAGRPAVLVPYPKATDNHQYFNAQAVEDVGGGWVMAQEGFTPQALAARIEMLFANPQVLADAAAKMKTLGKPDAAEALASVVNGA